jgi:hypothetical protein
MESEGIIHLEQYVLLTVALNGGTASLDIKNSEAVGYQSINLDEDSVKVVFLRPCEYKITTTGGAVVGIS